MQGLRNAFIVIVPKSHRNCETRLQLCYYIVCCLGNAGDELQVVCFSFSVYLDAYECKVLDQAPSYKYLEPNPQSPQVPST